MSRAWYGVVALVCLGATPLGSADKKGAVRRQHINPPGLVAPGARGYTQVVAVSGGRTVYVAGQVALNAQGDVVGKGDLRAQARQAYDNLRLALAGANAAFKDLVKINTYVVNLKPSDLPLLRDVRSEALKDLTPPTSTLVGVQALASPDFMVEIEAIAVVD